MGQGRTVTFAAEVGLLTRNIKIIGAPYDKLYSQAFGARVLVGTYTNDGTDYTGKANWYASLFYYQKYSTMHLEEWHIFAAAFFY